MPAQLEEVLRLVPRERLNWAPDDWEGVPGERFSALGQICHVRDIEVDGYHVRIRRMLEEVEPDLASLDGYALASERRYDESDPSETMAGIRAARAETVHVLSRVSLEQMARTGTFAEHGRVTLRSLVHYLRSHDEQHLACMHWLLGRIESVGPRL